MRLTGTITSATTTIPLRFSHVRRLDLRDRLHLFTDESDADMFMAPAGVDHYRLLAYLSLRFHFSRIFEFGTHAGRSAAALTVNPSNTVVSYDISDEKFRLRSVANLERRLGNIFVQGSQREMLSSAFILVDTAHDGDYEWEIFSYLNRNGYRGLLICDDIHWSDAMIAFWQKIDVLKYDVSEIGHLTGTGPRGKVSGTGLVDFGGVLDVIRD